MLRDEQAEPMALEENPDRPLAYQELNLNIGAIPMKSTKSTAQERSRAPLHSRQCFCRKSASTNIVRKKESIYIGQWVHMCGQVKSCGFFQAESQPPLEDCWCGDGRPAKMCISKKENSMGAPFATCGMNQCNYFRWLPQWQTKK